MRPLKVVPPHQLFQFAQQAGLLTTPSQPPPQPTKHLIPASEVLDHHGVTHDLPAFELETTPSFSLTIPDALVWGANLGVVYDGHLLPGGFSHQHFWAEDGKGNNNTSGSLQLPVIPIVDVPFPQVQMMGFSSHWGHFFTDTLDRLLAASWANELTIPMVTDSGGPCDPAMQILVTSGIINHPVEAWPLKKNALYRIKALRMHTLTSQKPAAPVESMLTLRARVHQAYELPPPGHHLPLFVGRQAVSVRRIVGQENLAEQLRRDGMAEMVLPETQDHNRNVALFRSRKKILLPIGSAKFNLIFCEPDTQVVCITPHGYAEENGGVCQLLRHMCAHLGLRLKFYSCRSVPIAGPRSHMRLHEDQIIDSSDIAPMLSLLDA